MNPYDIKDPTISCRVDSPGKRGEDTPADEKSSQPPLRRGHSSPHDHPLHDHPLGHRTHTQRTTGTVINHSLFTTPLEFL